MRGITASRTSPPSGATPAPTISQFAICKRPKRAISMTNPRIHRRRTGATSLLRHCDYFFIHYKYFRHVRQGSGFSENLDAQILRQDTRRARKCKQIVHAVAAAWHPCSTGRVQDNSNASPKQRTAARSAGKYLMRLMRTTACSTSLARKNIFTNFHLYFL